MSAGPLFLSSGDPTLDRRIEWARALIEDGSPADAAQMLAEATEQAPQLLSAWFLLGEAREAAGDAAGAIPAYRQALVLDPQDRLGAGPRLARLGASDPQATMSPAYVRTLFDQYAPRFDAALEQLGYRGPQLVYDALAAACVALGRPFAFGLGLDLGCGTGLVGALLAGHVARLEGVDLSPNMVARAQARGCYEAVVAGDMLDFLEAHAEGAADLVFAGDVFCYLDELGPILAGSARVLRPAGVEMAAGLLVFTVETHDGEGVVLRDTLRYAHAESHVRRRLGEAGLTLVSCERASTRTEGGVPVPGLVVVATKSLVAPGS